MHAAPTRAWPFVSAAWAWGPWVCGRSQLLFNLTGMDAVLRFIAGLTGYLQSGQFPNLVPLNYLVLFGLVAVEGPVSTLLGAAAASAGLMRPGWVCVSAASGNLTADMVWYSLGSAGKIEWDLRSGRWRGVRRSQLERLRRSMVDHAPKILFFAKLSAALMVPSLLAAGLAKSPWRRWFPFLLLGETIWTGSLVLLGYYATEAIKKVEAGVQVAALAGSAAFVLLLLYLVRRGFRSGKVLGESASDGLQDNP
jgi:membrane protein DedA with SNARE-associated domain